MSDFKVQIEKAAQRQRLLLLGFGGFGLVLILLFAVFILLVKATPIKVLPSSAAQEAAVTVSEGAALHFQGSLFSLSRYPVIQATAKGYASVERTIEPSEEGMPVEITMRELPAELVVKVTKPVGLVNWFVNGKAYPPAEIFTAELEAGQYVLRAEHSYYQPFEREFNLTRGESLTDEITLEKAVGRIHLDVTPSDADVTFNGRMVSEIPAEINTEAGQYEVEISKEGYATLRDVILLTFQQNEVKRHYRLQIKPAYVTVSASPKGGRLTLNGKSVAVGKKLQLSAGKKYYLKYEKDGYGSKEEEISLKPEEHRNVAFDMALKIGEVHINSTPMAAVSIDGKLAGNTPLKVRLPAMVHDFTIEKQGYQSFKKTIRLDPDKVQKIDITLKTERAAKLASAKPVYKNSLGMEMRLFAPTDIVLGAPRHEKGQRANEFLRSVNLTRHFYVATTETSEGQYSQFQNKRKQGDSFPVTNISWEEAARFCNWLSKAEGLPLFYKFDGAIYRGFDAQSTGYRLLSEAEWEWLARKAGRNKQTIFPWGDDAVIPKGAGNIADETANGKTQFYVPGYVDGYAAVAPVGSFDKDKAGLHDLFGNASEWVHDFYTLVPPVSGKVLTDPLGDQVGDKHMFKGASWASGTLTEIRPAYRASSGQGTDRIGFRVARYIYGDTK
ncbi:PEGA domain-containing protein [Sneathiella litorea]|uniref:PEGA domain-containing protein n=1 Tax=Sneathiella litorea TaxID=2606216 RepID=A0A6L8WDB0_9PROT|nr:PEGA domain-containing protein [Sneathiella litorea]MZR32363.1 PEGA domain-containing protein [Sneathiella litorea]